MPEERECIECPKCGYVGDLEYDFKTRENGSLAYGFLIFIILFIFLTGFSVGQWVQS